jgi:hypothetical protein
MAGRRSALRQNATGICQQCRLPNPAPLLLVHIYCAKTVSELHLLRSPGLLFERKQIPQIVVNVRIRETQWSPWKACRSLLSRGSLVRVQPRLPIISASYRVPRDLIVLDVHTNVHTASLRVRRSGHSFFGSKGHTGLARPTATGVGTNRESVES